MSSAYSNQFQCQIAAKNDNFDFWTKFAKIEYFWSKTEKSEHCR